MSVGFKASAVLDRARIKDYAYAPTDILPEQCPAAGSGQVR